jgi:hypothetical protein
MNDAKYIGLDVHQATISIAVLDWTAKLVMECILETKAAILLQFFHGLRGSLHVSIVTEACVHRRAEIYYQPQVSNTRQTHGRHARGPTREVPQHMGLFVLLRRDTQDEPR